MPKDKRFKTIKILIETGNITSFPEIFEHISESVVAKSLGTNYVRMLQLINSGKGFRFDDVLRLAKLCDVEPRILFNLIVEHYLNNIKAYRKNK
jgi:plasmid maintenance system antidote protein VapI